MLKEVQERLEHSDIEMTMNESTLFNDLIKINCAKISEVHLAMKCGRVVNIVSSGQKLFSQIKKTLSIKAKGVFKTPVINVLRIEVHDERL